MKILIVNGPNLNLLKTRNPEIYGNNSMDDVLKSLKELPNLTIDYFQSNYESEIVEKLQTTDAEGIVLNAGAYTHTSVAIRDAVEAIKTPVVEVHISNIYTRENFRKTSLLSDVCIGVISGFGTDSYKIAIDYLLKYN